MLGVIGLNVCWMTSRGFAVNARGSPPGANGPIGGGGGRVVDSFWKTNELYHRELVNLRLDFALDLTNICSFRYIVDEKAGCNRYEKHGCYKYRSNSSRLIANDENVTHPVERLGKWIYINSLQKFESGMQTPHDYITQSAPNAIIEDHFNGFIRNCVSLRIGSKFSKIGAVNAYLLRRLRL